jgi:prepilin-type N-terminal cleavage/methylation domain-containing protein
MKTELDPVAFARQLEAARRRRVRNATEAARAALDATAPRVQHGPQRSKTGRGFTLIELMVVVLIVGGVVLVEAGSHPPGEGPA